jgi:excisionase family DNA binding protein
MATDVMRQGVTGAHSVYVPIAEVAATLELSRARVYGLIAEGAIPAVRSGRRVRIPRASFEAFLRSQEQRALANLREPVGVAPETLRPEELAALDAIAESESAG